MGLYDLLQLIGGMLLAFSYLPQIKKIYVTKSVKDFSLLFWATLFIGLCLMEVNAVHLISLGTWSYAITETLNVILCGVLLIQIIYYRKKG